MLVWQPFLTLHLQVAALDPTRAGHQSSNTQTNTCSTADAVRIPDDASSQQLFGIMKQVLQSVQKYKPVELGDIASSSDLQAERMEQLLKSLEPQLQGDNLSEFVDAVSQLNVPLKELIETPSDLALGLEEVEVLKRLCLSNSQGLVTQLGEVCHCWQDWLISIARYESKCRDVQHLMNRKRLRDAVESIVRSARN